MKKYEAEAKFGHDSKEYKALEEEDTADKFIITSFYGVNGFAGFRLFDPDCANAITAVGRKIVNGLATFLTGHGFPVEYGDTDSIFVKLGEREYGAKVSDLVQQYLNTTLAEMGVKGTTINVKFEKFFKWCIFKRRKIRKGVYEAVKKKYVAHMIWSEGQDCDYMYIRGFETRRSDAPPVLKSTMEKFFEILRSGDFKKAVEVLRECKRTWHTRGPMELGIPRQVHKIHPDITNPWTEGKKEGEAQGLRYDPETAPSLLYTIGSPGVICIQKGHTLPASFSIDYEKMFEKTIKKKFEPLLEAMEINWEREIEPRGEDISKWF